MRQEERWQTKYNEAMEFLVVNYRNPSRHNLIEQGLYLNLLKQNRKLLNVGKMKEERVECLRNFWLLLKRINERTSTSNRFAEIRNRGFLKIRNEVMV